MNKHFTGRLAIVLGVFGAAVYGGASASSLAINDDFSVAADTNGWKASGGACLTAGDGTASNIPPCIGLPYYKGQVQIGGSNGYLGTSPSGSPPTSDTAELPDAPSSGALRFTNSFSQAGSIISTGTPFPTGSGLQIIFKTVTYRGDSGGSGKDGADGMAFFLMDGAFKPYDTGAFGGSLGYTCSNANNDGTTRSDGTVRGYDGLDHAYLGLGIDEYGNFLNQSDNTATGFGYVPGRIGLRGAGKVSWAALNRDFPYAYPSTLTVAQQASAVQATCKTGYVWDYTDPKNPEAYLDPKTKLTVPVSDYAAIPGAYTVLSTLLPGQNIANESAVTRSDATPITYNLKITQDGLLSLAISYGGGNYLPLISKQSITASNGALPASFRFGFTGSTGGSTNIHEILCFQAAPPVLGGTAVDVNQQEATKIASGTQAFFANYFANDNTGRLTAYTLLYDAKQTPQVFTGALANWDASCNLTGVPAGQTCTTTGAAGYIAPQAPAYPGRNILTWDGKKGVPFEWTALSSAEQAALDQGDATPMTANRLNYLRGDRTNEINSVGVGLFRARDGILGDIIDSSPAWVGTAGSPYTAAWKDLYVPSDVMPENSGTQSYTDYVKATQTRPNIVYDGSNDGLLHGFRSGTIDASGNLVTTTTPNDGAEVIAYMPGAVVQTIHNTTDPTQDFSNTQYSHNFFVDATPGTDDLFYNGTWHTWLVGGLGAGGPAIYALDITDPTQFDEANSSKVVIGEWNSSSISCVSNSGCGKNMGNTYGVPVIRRLHDGNWGIIFGNGFGSSSGDAGIFIMTINSSGVITNTYYLSTGSSGSNDGIANVAPADLDGDHVTDYVYAGDLLGNVWRFDLTSASEGSWAVSGPALFTVPSIGKTPVPITTKLLVSVAPQAGGVGQVMVDFGTGQKIPQSNLTPPSYVKGQEYLYGIWDWNMATWNKTSTTQLSSLASPQTITTANLTAQTLTLSPATTGPSVGTLSVTTNPVCWKGSTTCTGGSSANQGLGFMVSLPGGSGSLEQVIYNPILYNNAFLLNTTIPANNSPTNCQVTHETGETIAISVTTGGAIPGYFKNSSTTNAAGSMTNGTGAPFVVTAGGSDWILTQSLGGGANNDVANCTGLLCVMQTTTPAPTGKRLTWIQRR